MPTVSVVIPVFNRAHLIERALKSVLNQTFSDLEVVIADDCSTDDLAGVVESLADARVRIVRHTERSGGTAARNTGVQHSNGELVAFLDSDDEWTPDKLAVQMKALESRGRTARPLLPVNRNRRDGEPGRPPMTKDWVERSGQEVRQALTGARPLGLNAHWMTMLIPRKELLAMGGFDPSLPALQWWDLVYRLSDRCDFMFGPQILLVQYDPGGERVRTIRNMGRAAEILQAKYVLSGAEAKVTRSQHLTWAGMYRLSEGNYWRAISQLGAAFVARPTMRSGLRLGGAVLGRGPFFALQRVFGRRPTGAMGKAPGDSESVLSPGPGPDLAAKP